MSGDGFLITVAGSDKSSRLKPLSHLSPPRERPVQQRTSGQGAPWEASRMWGVGAKRSTRSSGEPGLEAVHVGVGEWEGGGSASMAGDAGSWSSAPPPAPPARRGRS